MLELVNACTIPEKLVKHSTCIHSIFSGGVASQGEVHSRGNDLHECLWLTWWVPLSTRGGVCDSSSFAFGGEWCDFWKFLPCGKGELSVHLYGWVLHIVRGCILGWFSLSGSELLHALSSAVSSLCLFLEESVWCLCVTVLSSASFLRGHALFDRLRWAVTLVLGGRSLSLHSV